MSELADLLKAPTPLGIRVGIVTAVIDSRHVMVDIGERTIGAAWPASLGTPVVDIDVTLVVGDGVARVITSSRAPTSDTALSYVTGWQTAPGQDPATAYRDGGWAWVEGTVVRASGTSGIMATLPAGYRPARRLYVPLVGINGGNTVAPPMFVDVDPDGSVRITAMAGSGYTWSATTWIPLPSMPWRIGG